MVELRIMKKGRRLAVIKKKITDAKEELFNNIARQFGADVSVKLARQETIFLGAQGCFEGGEILINRDLPLFWQLIILEHEIGHYFAASGQPAKIGIVHRFQTHKLSSTEKRAWQWVAENPIARGGVVDREIKKYIKELQGIGKKYGHGEYVMRLGWWY